MKNTLLFIISILIVQSAWAQKVDWNKPLYTISVSTYHDFTEEDFKRFLDWMPNSEGEEMPDEIMFPFHFRIVDTVGTYTYLGDTMIYNDKYGRTSIYIGGKPTYEEYDSNCILKYDTLGSLSSQIKYSDTISYTNKYDKKNRLIKIIGTDKKKIFIKYRGTKKIENSHTPKDRYHRIYYCKDPNYQNDTLIITYRPRNCQYTRTEYDSLDRPLQIDYWADSGLFCEKGIDYKEFHYIDNIKICIIFEIDCAFYSGTIYKKEEE